MTARKTIYGYWGTNDDTLSYQDERQVRVGTTHKMKEKKKPNVCVTGMHACFHPSQIPISKHSRMTKIYFVKIQGDITNQRRKYNYWSDRVVSTPFSDKFAGRERTYLGVVTGRDLPEKFVKYQGNGIYHFKWEAIGFNDAVREAFIEKYPELKANVESTLTVPPQFK